MDDYMEKIFDYRLKGYCCTQILMQLGLDEKGTENPDLINAVKGLCNGLHSGLLCGALSGGVCLLSLFAPDKAHIKMIPALVEWFEDSFESFDCEALVGDAPRNKAEKCSEIVVRTYEKVKELLEYNR